MVRGKSGKRGRVMGILQRDTDEVIVDYPKSGEVVTSSDYSFRVGAVPEASSVEISINGGDWMACRESLGLWWFDWQDYPSGVYTIQARIRKEGGVTVASFPRRFSVQLEGSKI